MKVAELLVLVRHGKAVEVGTIAQRLHVAAENDEISSLVISLVKREYAGVDLVEAAM